MELQDEEGLPAAGRAFAPSRSAGAAVLLPVRRVLLADVTASHLRGHLHAGVFPGMLLSERDLSALLGVSRPTLRKALKQLEDEGWLEPRPGGVRRVLRGSGAWEGGEPTDLGAAPRAGFRAGAKKREAVVARLLIAEGSALKVPGGFSGSIAPEAAVPVRLSQSGVCTGFP